MFSDAPAWDPWYAGTLESFGQRLASGRPLIAVELRPPRKDLDSERAMDAWIDVHQSVRRLSRRDTVIFLTDNAVGSEEEESLTHLLRNLGDEADLGRIVPFLTLKHSLGYCLEFARRARTAGFPGLVVLGGDRHDGIPRCLPHAHELRRRIRDVEPGLLLGGWANPHRDPVEQVGYLCEHIESLDFVLTQIVSHHDAAKVERFVDELRRRKFGKPVIAGVFHYRSAKARTLDKLSQFIPVPRDGLQCDFEERGMRPSEITSETIACLARAGLPNVYVSNLRAGTAGRGLERIAELAGKPLHEAV